MRSSATVPAGHAVQSSAAALRRPRGRFSLAARGSPALTRRHQSSELARSFRSPTSSRACRCMRTSVCPALVARVPLLVLATDWRARGRSRAHRGIVSKIGLMRGAIGRPGPVIHRAAGVGDRYYHRWRGRVILLDEPPGMSRSETKPWAHSQCDPGQTLVMVEHDMGVVFGLADRISVLVYSRVLAAGTPKEIRSNAAVRNPTSAEKPA